MNESKLIKMEDLLPYFDEQDSISNFKEDICKAISGYKKKIDELNNELRESKASAQQVKGELKNIKERYIELEGMQACEVCNRPAMKKSFYVYPCAHSYHRDCLLEMMLAIFKVKDYIKAGKIDKILEEIAEKEGKIAPKKGKGWKKARNR
jgi:DNA repair exonuclease SbcCD ATPase subunit